MNEVSWITESFWIVAPVIVSFTLALSQAINSKFNISGWYKQLVSWGVAGVLSVGAWFLNFVTLGEPLWASLIAFIVVNGLVSNGIFDIPTIKAFIEKWFSFKKKD